MVHGPIVAQREAAELHAVQHLGEGGWGGREVSEPQNRAALTPRASGFSRMRGTHGVSHAEAASSKTRRHCKSWKLRVS